ncbi:unnamed protein product [Closterium sp. NIES-53]
MAHRGNHGPILRQRGQSSPPRPFLLKGTFFPFSALPSSSSHPPFLALAIFAVRVVVFHVTCSLSVLTLCLAFEAVQAGHHVTPDHPSLPSSPHVPTYPTVQTGHHVPSLLPFARPPPAHPTVRARHHVPLVSLSPLPVLPLSPLPLLPLSSPLPVLPLSPLPVLPLSPLPVLPLSPLPLLFLSPLSVLPLSPLPVLPLSPLPLLPLSPLPVFPPTQCKLGIMLHHLSLSPPLCVSALPLPPPISQCELDIMFHLEKAYFMLDEMVMNGCVMDTNKLNVLAPIQLMDKSS